MRASSPIAVLDSGLGGLTIVKALRQRLPQERIVCFGDTARLPYGGKSPAVIVQFVSQIVSFLERFGPKHVVIGCNTATALALPAVRGMFPNLSISGVVEPGAKAAAIAAGSKPSPSIGVIATEATVRSRAYARAIGRRRHHAKLLFQATPLLVPLIEEGRAHDDPVVKLALRQYLSGLMSYGIDVLLLGCTHYPVLRQAIVEAVGPSTRVIDSAEQCADDVARRLQTAGLLNSTTASDGTLTHPAAADAGPPQCFVTDDPARFQRLAKRFLDMEIDLPTWVAAEELRDPATIAAPRPIRHAG